ncbi:MAG TPA: ATP-binding protein [Holophagaceae bacterium]|nr:ATP-binding protein [Holophagaceae bacterium]
MANRYQLTIRDRHGFERTLPLLRSVTLGRQSSCDVVLSDSMISRAHLRLELDEEGWWAEDLGSSHGSFLKDQPLQARVRWTPETPIRLADGAYILTLLSQSQSSSEAHLQAILGTAQLLAQEVELDDLLEQSLDRLLSISGTDRGFLMLLEGGELTPKVQRNLDRQLESDIHLSMSSIHKVFETGEPIWILNVSDNEAMKQHQSIVRLELKTILCLPLTLQGKRIGVVYLDSRKPIIEPPDRGTFEAIVALCAIAIERTRLSEENLRSQVLATVGQVASSIVHDFKNGLFALRGHAELLELSSRDEKVLHHTQKILENVERLGTLSADVLDFAKVREPRRTAVDLNPYFEGIIEPLLGRAKELGVTLRCEGEPCGISLDAPRFTRVVENLLSNAIEAVAARLAEDGVEPPGDVCLTWHRVTGGVQVRVADNGKGIPRKVLKRIFEPFFSHGKKRGTGLGMATVKKIVEEHGGTLEVISEQGQGTEVVISLPEHASANVDTKPSKVHPESTGELRRKRSKDDSTGGQRTFEVSP